MGLLLNQHLKKLTIQDGVGKQWTLSKTAFDRQKYLGILGKLICIYEQKKMIMHINYLYNL